MKCTNHQNSDAFPKGWYSECQKIIEHGLQHARLFYDALSFSIVMPMRVIISCV